MGSFNSQEFASNSKANTGVTLGSIGLGLGVLNALGGNGNGGLLGNLLGGGCNSQELSMLRSENALLKANNYADKVDKEVYMQTLRDNNDLRNELYAFIKPISEESANNRVELATLKAEFKCNMEKQALQDQITAGKINEAALALNGKIDTMTANINGKFSSLDQTISCIKNTLGGITQTYVPIDSVTPQPMPLYNSWCTPSNTCNGSSAPKSKVA